MDLRHRSFHNVSPSNTYQVHSPRHFNKWNYNQQSFVTSSPINNMNQNIGGGRHQVAKNINDNHNNGTPQNWRQSLEKILHHDYRSAISLKCDKVEELLASISNKELIETFPYLLNDIFGFNQAHGWGLNRLEPRMYSTDFNKALHFLSPNGTLFKLINRLINDHEAVFQYPFTALPDGIIESIEKGNIPIFYANKIVHVDTNNIVVYFNSFEYYFALFAYYVAQQDGSNNNANSSEDVLYIQLLEDYLRFFFPLDFSTSLASTPHGDTKQPFRSTNTSSKFNLWKSPDIAHQADSWASPSRAQFLNSAGKGDIFLQILSDFWLSNNRQDIRHDQVWKLPSFDHARAVRVLVKYFHTFANILQDNNVQTFAHETNQVQYNEMKRYTVPASFHKKLYVYLVGTFKHWPLDSTFRMVLETWLSFIQPWRYRQLNHHQSLNDSIQVNVSEWADFISNNILFYTSLFVMFIKRSLRMEMQSPKNMFLLYRVAKVYSQSNLIETLRSVLGNASLKHDFNSASSVLADPYEKFSSQRKHLDTQYFDIFDSEVTSLVHGLCSNLAKTCIITRKDIFKTANSENSKRKGFFAKLTEFFMIDDNYEHSFMLQEEKLLEYLEQSCHLLTTMFELPPFETQLIREEKLAETVGSANENLPKPDLSKTDYDDGITPDFIMTEAGYRLTDLGREQILRRQRHFEFCYSGDPELQSVRPYENKFMVKGLYALACKSNEKYGQQLYSLYNRNDFISRFFRKISKEVENTRFINCPIRIPKQRVDLSEVKPRVSFRFASSYYYMGYLFWMIIFSRLFGLSWFGISILLLVVIVTSIIYYIDSPPRKMQNEIR